MQRLVLSLLILVLTPALYEASRVRLVNLEEMTHRASLILAGRCVDLRTVLDPDLDLEVTLVTLNVRRTVKGTTDRTVTIKLAGRQHDGTASGTVARFRLGEEVILFLYGESDSGLTSPVGLDQGKFVVLNDKQGRQVAINEFGNRTLFRGLSEKAKRRLGQEPQRWRGRKGIPPDALLDMVDSLTR